MVCVVWGRQSLTIVISQLYSTVQCSAEHFLDFAFICFLVVTLGVRYVPVPMQVITCLATVNLRGC